MLLNSFIIAPSVGTKTEKKLWKKGIKSWFDFIINFNKIKMPPGMKEEILKSIKETLKNFYNFNPLYFENLLPRSEKWRFYKEFKNSTIFVDIETNGLNTGYNCITVIGVYNGKTYKGFVKEKNLLEAEDELDRYKLIVTYNGSCFDLPLIYDLFPRLEGRHIHIDVMYPLRRIGYKGGLKAIEESLGIKREGEIAKLSGWDAVYLWNDYISGNKKALDLLLKYNYADCKNLKPLMEFAYTYLKKQIFD